MLDPVGDALDGALAAVVSPAGMIPAAALSPHEAEADGCDSALLPVAESDEEPTPPIASPSRLSKQHSNATGLPPPGLHARFAASLGMVALPDNGVAHVRSLHLQNTALLSPPWTGGSSSKASQGVLSPGRIPPSHTHRMPLDTLQSDECEFVLASPSQHSYNSASPVAPHASVACTRCEEMEQQIRALEAETSSLAANNDSLRKVVGAVQREAKERRRKAVPAECLASDVAEWKCKARAAERAAAASAEECSALRMRNEALWHEMNERRAAEEAQERSLAELAHTRDTAVRQAQCLTAELNSQQADHAAKDVERNAAIQLLETKVVNLERELQAVRVAAARDLQTMEAELKVQRGTEAQAQNAALLRELESWVKHARTASATRGAAVLEVCALQEREGKHDADAQRTPEHPGSPPDAPRSPVRSASEERLVDELASIRALYAARVQVEQERGEMLRRELDDSHRLLRDADIRHEAELHSLRQANAKLSREYTAAFRALQDAAADTRLEECTKELAASRKRVEDLETKAGGDVRAEQARITRLTEQMATLNRALLEAVSHKGAAETDTVQYLDAKVRENEGLRATCKRMESIIAALEGRVLQECALHDATARIAEEKAGAAVAGVSIEDAVAKADAEWLATVARLEDDNGKLRGQCAARTAGLHAAQMEGFMEARYAAAWKLYAEHIEDLHELHGVCSGLRVTELASAVDDRAFEYQRIRAVLAASQQTATAVQDELAERTAQLEELQAHSVERDAIIADLRAQVGRQDVITKDREALLARMHDAAAASQASLGELGAQNAALRQTVAGIELEAACRARTLRLESDETTCRAALEAKAAVMYADTACARVRSLVLFEVAARRRVEETSSQWYAIKDELWAFVRSNLAKEEQAGRTQLRQQNDIVRQALHIRFLRSLANPICTARASLPPTSSTASMGCSSEATSEVSHRRSTLPTPADSLSSAVPHTGTSSVCASPSPDTAQSAFPFASPSRGSVIALPRAAITATRQPHLALSPAGLASMRMAGSQVILPCESVVAMPGHSSQVSGQSSDPVSAAFAQPPAWRVAVCDTAPACRMRIAAEVSSAFVTVTHHNRTM
eukprot:TRINITY_DN10009_c0_g1_i1.p1 TRINITY_DN10009_c0_g1~~TRINITY_DN10009_c0_g1_i1.p1  ORF type:complete len:1096 (+),score=66.96 TRINITY_DN10009_c0_g1_i1:103-3390(+)